MGGHAVERGSTVYAEAGQLANVLAAKGFVVATGGGPRTMAAANLGAFARYADVLPGALTSLAAVPAFRPDAGANGVKLVGVRSMRVLGVRGSRPIAGPGCRRWVRGRGALVVAAGLVVVGGPPGW